MVTSEMKEDLIAVLSSIETEMDFNSDPYVGRRGNNRLESIEKAVASVACILRKTLEAK